MLSFKGTAHLLAAFTLALTPAIPASAQYFPNFGSGTNNTSFNLEYSPAVIQYGSSLYPNALFMAYVNGQQPNNLAWGYSIDGQNFNNVGSMIDYITGQRFNVLCNAGNPNTCAAGVAYFNGYAYAAFADEYTGGIDVVQIIQVPSNAGFLFHLVYSSNAVSVNAAPAMSVNPSGTKLIIRYGTNNSLPTKNVTWNTSLDLSGTFSTYPSNAYAPTQSAMVVFNGTFYSIDKQNNSNNAVFVSHLDDDGVYINSTAAQIPGWFTPTGISATVFNGYIVAAIQSNSSNHDLWVFSSSDGANWYGHDYGSANIHSGQTPSIATNNGGISYVLQANDPSHSLWSDFTPF